MMFQSYRPVFRIMASSNSAFGLKQDKLNKAADHRRVDGDAQLVHMTLNTPKRNPISYRWQRSRVALGRSRGKSPSVLSR